MTVDTLYLIVSLSCLGIYTLLAVNTIHVKRTGRTIIGEEVTPDVAGYKKFQNLSSIPGIVIMTIVGAALIGNLAYCAYKILNLQDSQQKGFLLIVAIAIVLLIASAISFGRHTVRSDKSEKE
jgi:hypothetical protein